MTDVRVDQTLVIRPTGNEWDAPVTHFVFDDGSGILVRDGREPGRRWVRRDFYPHAVLIGIDGQMSPFDQARQPAGAHR